MADRILIWHIPDSPNPLSLPRYYMEADYVPVALRVYADTKPETDDLRIDIRDDGVSIFKNQPSTTFTTLGQRTTTPTTTPVLIKGDNSEEDAGDFLEDALGTGSWISCVIADWAGAKGVTIQLELDKVGESNESEG